MFTDKMTDENLMVSIVLYLNAISPAEPSENNITGFVIDKNKRSLQLDVVQMIVTEFEMTVIYAVHWVIFFIRLQGKFGVPAPFSIEEKTQFSCGG
jgi:hypothetical protein